LKVTLSALLLAGEGDFGYSLLEKITNRSVRDLAHLVVLLDNFAACVADATIAFAGEGIAYAIRGANVAVDSRPPFVALAAVGIAYWSVRATGQGSTD
jgi:hypothetical protein